MKKDIYYIPDFDNEFSIEKLLNLKKILGDKAMYDPHIVLNPYELVIWKVVLLLSVMRINCMQQL